jgi:GNAT superfamily N-acetyltransferase
METMAVETKAKKIVKKEVKKTDEKESWMKGLKVIEAEPSNNLDIYAILKSAIKDKVWGDQNPTDKQLKDWHFLSLIQEIVREDQVWLLARRGKHYFGCAHAVKRPGRWPGDTRKVWVDLVYVEEKKRKYGIGKKLIDGIIKWAEEENIKEFYFFAEEGLDKTWQKKRKAKKISNYMKVVL